MPSKRTGWANKGKQEEIMRTIKTAYEIGMGSVIVFTDSMYFAGMVTALLIDLLYEIICWAGWVLSL